MVRSKGLFQKIRRPFSILLAVLMGCYSMVLFKTAWLSDDSAITLRTVLNFIHGFGPSFNVDERVQAYTHPLWFFLISAISFVIRDVLASTFIVSILISILAFSLGVVKFSKSYVQAIVFSLAVLLSKAYIDFSSSGLENPMAHLILLGIVLVAQQLFIENERPLPQFFFLCSLLYLTRSDLVLLILPLLVWVVFFHKIKRSELSYPILVGFMPAMLWTVFSLFYYGFPFPNTAYAKLGTGIPWVQLMKQGLAYFGYTLEKDPVTLFVVVTGIIVGFASRFVLDRALSLGIVFYLFYVLNIGGDFMGGRFFSTPFWISNILMLRGGGSRKWFLGLALLILILGSRGLEDNILSGLDYKEKPWVHGISDERSAYLSRYGLATYIKGILRAPPWKMGRRDISFMCGGLGFNSIFRGPGVHYVDTCALTDPLLARLPSKQVAHWRIGHFYRQLPTDYLESLALGENNLTDPETHEFWESIRKITRGPLVGRKRIAEIAKVNLGLIQKPNFNRYRFSYVPMSSKVIEVEIEKLSHIISDGAWNQQGTLTFLNSVQIRLLKPVNINTIDLSLDHNDHYQITAFAEGKWRVLANILPVSKSGMNRHRLTINPPMVGTSLIRIGALSGDGRFSIGHLLINPTHEFLPGK